MARTKGTPKTGGRAKGQPNKVTGDIKARLQAIINGYDIEADLNELEPQQRISVMERLMQYIIPKQQSVSVDAQIQAEYKELEKLLLSAPDEAVDRLAERIQTLNNLNHED
ncbi:hypothetical protein [Parabacteroides sp. PF5-9]|uniref:hypothetical protein n=1 Tax=Parabacteroides sp. PF5-9 TaxID=1742404 RepID=UPI002475FC06|nr:hypothetical protein [Parabacteroides sp. PF5-9]MDH6356260.1 hypothetical protein [Parabacteroides sp. PF5-9]